MAIEELRAMDVGECLGRRAPHHHDTAFVPQKNGCCSEMGNLRRAANNHQHTVLTDARVASVAAPRIFPSGRNFSACDRAGTRQPRTFTAVVQKFTGLSFSTCPPKNNETTLAKRATGRS